MFSMVGLVILSFKRDLAGVNFLANFPSYCGASSHNVAVELLPHAVNFSSFPLLI